MENTKLIVIAGPSASGKTTLVRTLYQQLSDYISVLSTDNYFHPFSHLPLEKRAQQNYDHPDSIDINLLTKHLNLALNLKEFATPNYCFKQHTRLSHGTNIAPKPIIILEGVLALTLPQVTDMADLKVFINTPLDICLARKVRRDIIERGRTLSQSLNQYESIVRPMYYLHTSPSKLNADILLPDGGNISKAIELIRNYVVSYISEEQGIYHE